MKVGGKGRSPNGGSSPGSEICRGKTHLLRLELGHTTYTSSAASFSDPITIPPTRTFFFHEAIISTFEVRSGILFAMSEIYLQLEYAESKALRRNG